MLGVAPSPASDVYSFGLVMREMTAGIPTRWQEVIGCCLEPDPSLRPKQEGEALALLDVTAPEKEVLVTVPRRTFLAWGCRARSRGCRGLVRMARAGCAAAPVARASVRGLDAVLRRTHKTGVCGGMCSMQLNCG